MSLESLHIVLNVASAVLLGLTFIVGAGAIITGLRLGNRQAERIAVVTHETAMANKQKPTQTKTGGGGRLKNYRGGDQFYGMAASGVDKRMKPNRASSVFFMVVPLVSAKRVSLSRHGNGSESWAIWILMPPLTSAACSVVGIAHPSVQWFPGAVA